MDTSLKNENKNDIKQFIIIGLTVLFVLIFSILYLVNNIKNSCIYFNRKMELHQRPDLNEIESKLNVLIYSKFNNASINVDIKIKDIMIKTEDGEDINALYLINPFATKTILYSHGNAGLIYNLTNIFFDFGEHASIIMYDYRGYGRSTGTPYEGGLYKDITAVWNYLTNVEKIKPSNITIYGHSLGASVSSWLASKLNNNFNSLILQSGFASIHEISKNFVGCYGLYLIKNEFSNVDHISKINHDKILIIHSSNDDIVPLYHAELIHNSNKKSVLKIFDEGDHNIVSESDEYYNLIKSFI
jgi:uncharacterized protein